MGTSIKMYEEIMNHLKLYPIKRLLLVGENDDTFLNLLHQVFGEIQVDLLVLSEELNQDPRSYHQLLSLEELGIEPSYDVAVFMEGFDEFDYEDGYEFINRLLKVTNYYVLLMTNNDFFNQGKWLVTNFKKYDVSYFTRVFENEIKQIYKLYVNQQPNKSDFFSVDEVSFKPLKLTFVMPHKNLTGGLKMLYEQMKFLQKRGHRIQIILKGNTDCAKADWVADFTPDEDTVISQYERFIDHIKDSQLIFAGFYHQLQELANDQIPVVYWEQGHEALYGDVRTIQDEIIVRSMLQDAFKQDIYLASDSKYVQEVLESKFHRKSYLLPNFIDTHFYYPDLEKQTRDEPIILLVGNPSLSFKGFEKALMTLMMVWNEGVRFKVAWACQVKPILPALPFEIEFYEQLPQPELARLYRNSDILLSCSLYEGCPMPPLEAMASGVAVVATDCEGIKQYATHLENALISQTHRIEELALNVMRLIQDTKLRQLLIENGLKTAKSLNYEKGGEVLEKIALAIDADFNQKKRLIPKKKKVLFMIGTLLEGEAARVLVNIVKYINRDKFDVTVQTINDTGIYIDEIKKYAKYKTIFKTIAHSQEELNFLTAHYEYLRSLSLEEFCRVVINEKYDVEIAFLEDQSTQFIAYSPNQQAKKIGWIHNDSSANNNVQSCFQSEVERVECYQRFNEIVCVSERVKEDFKNRFKNFEKALVIYNSLDSDKIAKQIDQQIDDVEMNHKFKIVSVGSLQPRKGYDRLLKIHKQLMNEGFDYELWIIGDGEQKEELEQFILENKLESSVKLLGVKENPYKYINCCDLFICSSRTEENSLVIKEAFILGIPVLSTNFLGSAELLSDGEYGILVENSSLGIYVGLKKILSSVILFRHYQQQAVIRGMMFQIRKQIELIENLLEKE